VLFGRENCVEMTGGPVKLPVQSKEAHGRGPFFVTEPLLFSLNLSHMCLIQFKGPRQYGALHFGDTGIRIGTCLKISRIDIFPLSGP
jgi:hypothetical protein